MRFTAKISVLLLMSLLILSGFGSLFIQNAKADDYGYAVFNPNCVIEDVDSTNEVYYTNVICGYIYDMLDSFYVGGTHHYWFYGSEQQPVHPSNYSDILETLQDYCDWVTVFSKGHCVPWGYAWHHRELLGTLSSFDPPNGEQVKDSVDIWPHTDGGYPSKNRFSFIWHCGTADMYPLSPPYEDIDGPIGMPFCFTHNVAMNYYGTSGSYAYLGWNGTSPQFDCLIPDQAWQGWYWSHFAYYFFYWAVQYNSIWATLNELSWEIYGNNFQFTPLNGYLIVWGNRDMYLY
jgi:hypothetical protein